MADTYATLCSSIVRSTVWDLPDHARLVWVTMLAIKDKDGCVWSSIPGLAHEARVALDRTEDALRLLGAPDAYSSTKDHEGRRILPIDGGWLIVTHAKHRRGRDPEKRRKQNREAQARFKSKPVSATVSRGKPLSVSDHDQIKAEQSSSQDLADPENLTTLSGKPDVGPCQTCVSGLMELNSLAGTNYRLTSKAALKAAHARHTEHGDESLLVVVRHKCRDWVRDPKMAKFLRPATLFRASNFAAYLDDALGGNTKPAGAGTFDYSDEGTIWPVTVVKVGK